MLILPYSTELRFNWKSYVSYTIIILSLFIFIMQDKNRRAINPILSSYCLSISGHANDIDTLDLLRESSGTCRYVLGIIHSLPDKALVDTLFKPDLNEYTESQATKIIEYIKSHYSAFSLVAPASLDARLEYNPTSFNPARSLLSALAHADWWHLIGNLIFFITFAPAIELIIGNTLKFILVLILIEFSCDITYTVVALSSGKKLAQLFQNY
ncbi:MAG TPA: rhomboid family intramembrane serine protease [Gammaproteobacteria bacterium]|nr:rhomboid family intramembrane serine protease [Gammaproteobacteria bacterium]